MRPPAAPTSSLATAGVYTANDREIAELVKASAGQAIPDLKGLNARDPSQLEDLFLPLGTWIADQRTSVEAYTPTDCTAVAVAKFVEGMDAYDDIRKRFLAWRDWGAHGNAFHPEAPRQAAALLERGAGRARGPLHHLTDGRNRPPGPSPRTVDRRCTPRAVPARAPGRCRGGRRRIRGRSGRWPPIPLVAARRAGTSGLGDDGIGGSRLSVLRRSSSRRGHAPAEPHPFRCIRHARREPAGDDVTDLLRDWSDAAACMTQGLAIRLPEYSGSNPHAPRDDTG